MCSEVVHQHIDPSLAIEHLLHASTDGLGVAKVKRNDLRVPELAGAVGRPSHRAVKLKFMI